MHTSGLGITLNSKLEFEVDDLRPGTSVLTARIQCRRHTMDILSRERPAKLEYQYLKSADQAEKSNHKKADEELFPIQASANILKDHYII